METKVEAWIKKIEKSKEGSVDLSRDEDLSIALMNLVSLEEHFYFTAMKTGNGKYLNMLKEVREIRKDFLAWIVTEPEGEEWCISKHLLASSMRLVEVGTKELSKGEQEKAEKCFNSAFRLYSLFFAINLKMVGYEELEETENDEMSRFSKVIKKVVDCCKEW